MLQKYLWQILELKMTKVYIVQAHNNKDMSDAAALSIIFLAS